VVVTAANVHDLTPVAELLHGDEEVVYGDVRWSGFPGQPPSLTSEAGYRP